MTVRVALVQTRTPASQEAALDHLAPMIRHAAAEGARLILTPEGSNLLQRDRALLGPLMRTLQEDPAAQGLGALARSLNVEILAGSLLVKRDPGEGEGASFANRSVLFRTDGSASAYYDKIHMFDVDLPNGESPRESRTYAPGDRAVLTPSAAGLIGMTICYDVRFPGLYRTLAQAGAEVMTIPAAFTRPTGEAHWEVLLRARAIETGSFVLAPAQGGLHEDGRRTWGRSMAVSPWGEVIAAADHDEPTVILADLDLEAVTRARSAIPSLRNGRVFSAPEVGRAAAE